MNLFWEFFELNWNNSSFDSAKYCDHFKWFYLNCYIIRMIITMINLLNDLEMNNINNKNKIYLDYDSFQYFMKLLYLINAFMLFSFLSQYWNKILNKWKSFQEKIYELNLCTLKSFQFIQSFEWEHMNIDYLIHI